MSQPYRHGDLVFKPRTSKPHGQVVFSGKEAVLAEGEETGHAHRMKGLFDVFSDGLNGSPTGVAVLERSEMSHEEHGTITMEPGNYDIKQPIEYDSLEDETYAVAD